MVDGVNGVSELDCNGYGQENGMELKSQEEGMAIDIDVVEELKKDKSELNHKEMARLGFLIAPVWFITEVMNLFVSYAQIFFHLTCVFLLFWFYKHHD